MILLDLHQIDYLVVGGGHGGCWLCRFLRIRTILILRSSVYSLARLKYSLLGAVLLQQLVLRLLTWQCRGGLLPRRVPPQAFRFIRPLLRRLPLLLISTQVELGSRHIAVGLQGPLGLLLSARQRLHIHLERMILVCILRVAPDLGEVNGGYNRRHGTVLWILGLLRTMICLLLRLLLTWALVLLARMRGRVLEVRVQRVEVCRNYLVIALVRMSLHVRRCALWRLLAVRDRRLLTRRVRCWGGLPDLSRSLHLLSMITCEQPIYVLLLLRDVIRI